MKKIIIPILFTLALGACSATPTSNNSPTPVPATPTTSVQSASDSTTITTKVYSLDEVAKHATPKDCWLALNGKVYDVTGFGAKHPGEEAVYQGCGQDATTLFETRPMGSKTPHSEKARTFLPNFEIGLLAQ